MPSRPPSVCHIQSRLLPAVPVLLHGDADGPIRAPLAPLDLGDAPWMTTAAVIVP
jgi:hypothetical protein